MGIILDKDLWCIDKGLYECDEFFSSLSLMMLELVLIFTALHLSQIPFFCVLILVLTVHVASLI